MWKADYAGNKSTLKAVATTATCASEGYMVVTIYKFPTRTVETSGVTEYTVCLNVIYA